MATNRQQMWSLPCFKSPSDQQFLATKTASVVFKQYDRQSVTELSDVSSAPILWLCGTQTRKLPIFGAPR